MAGGKLGLARSRDGPPLKWLNLDGSPIGCLSTEERLEADNAISGPVPPLPITQLISKRPFVHQSFSTCSTPVRPLRTSSTEFNPSTPLPPKSATGATFPSQDPSIHSLLRQHNLSHLSYHSLPRKPKPLAETSFALQLLPAFVDQPFSTVAQSQIKRLKPIRRAQEAADAASLEGQRDKLSTGGKLRRPSGLPPITLGILERKETALR